MSPPSLNHSVMIHYTPDKRHLRGHTSSSLSLYSLSGTSAFILTSATLLSFLEILNYEPCLVTQACNIYTPRQEDCKFKARLDYRVQGQSEQLRQFHNNKRAARLGKTASVSKALTLLVQVLSLIPRTRVKCPDRGACSRLQLQGR